MTKRRKSRRRGRNASIESLETRIALSSVPLLHSYPESAHKLFLDFDGHVTEGTTWNHSLSKIHSPPFDVDDIKYDANHVATFNKDEVSRIVSIWERMAEDFRPFNVDVTTEDPTRTSPDIFQRGGQAQRIVFTSKYDAGLGGTGERWFEQTTLGIATESWSMTDDTPVWVFSVHPLAGEIASHEAGHAFDLHHDGYFVDDQRFEYRGEHGYGETRWSPIMGAGNNLSQWSNGEYPTPTNSREDDVGTLAAALGRRPDDYTSIVPLTSEHESAVDVEGIIETQGDTDIFSFEITQSPAPVTLDISPWHNGPNLDVGVSLYGLTTGMLIRFNDPVANPVDQLASSIDIQLEPGTYYLTVNGVGKSPTPDDPGYTDYGSLGYYRITGTVGEATLRGDTNTDGILSADDIDALYAMIGVASDPGTQQDLSGDGEIDQADVDVFLREIFRTEYGDLDLNGKIEFADFLTLSANFGKDHKGWASGDVTGDGKVAFEDFLLLAANFGFDTKDS